MNSKTHNTKDTLITWLYIILVFGAMFGMLFLFEISKKV